MATYSIEIDQIDRSSGALNRALAVSECLCAHFEGSERTALKNEDIYTTLCVVQHLIEEAKAIIDAIPNAPMENAAKAA